MGNGFRNPSNGYVETIGPVWLWAFLFGAIWLAVRGFWGHALLYAAIGIATGGFGLIVLAPLYAILAGGMVRKSYLSKGWEPV